MKFKEIEKIANNIRKTISKTYGFKQSGYINWKIKDGYFIYLDTLHIIKTELKIKPVYLDDLYWKIIYPHKKTKFPDSLRGNGQLSYLSEKIWEEWFPKNLKTDFSSEQYEQIITDVFHKAETEINSFLQKYPQPIFFGQYMIDNNRSSILSEVLVLINDKKFQEASQLARICIKKEPHVLNSYKMEDMTIKSEYEFILEYCLKRIQEK